MLRDLDPSLKKFQRMSKHVFYGKKNQNLNGTVCVWCAVGIIRSLKNRLICPTLNCLCLHCFIGFFILFSEKRRKKKEIRKVRTKLKRSKRCRPPFTPARSVPPFILFKTLLKPSKLLWPKVNYLVNEPESSGNMDQKNV